MKAKETCNKPILFGGDYGEDPVEFNCNLPKGHKGRHKATGKGLDGELYSLTFTDPIKDEKVDDQDRFKE